MWKYLGEKRDYFNGIEVKVFICPSDRVKRSTSVFGKRSYSINRGEYVNYGGRFCIEGITTGPVDYYVAYKKKLSKIEDPGGTVAVGEFMYAYNFAAGNTASLFSFSGWGNNDEARRAEYAKYGGNIHSQGANYLFVDGHVEYLPLHTVTNKIFTTWRD